MSSLDPLFRPASIAIIGASSDAMKIGGRPVDFLKRAGYAGRIKARVKPNVTFTDEVAGNPLASVEVRCAPDGTIIGRRLVKSSGVPAWDDAVLRAIDKTEILPRDVDGRVPSPMVLDFRPRDF